MTFGSADLCVFELDGNELKVTSYSGFSRPTFVEKVLVLADSSFPASNTVLQSGSMPSREAQVRGVAFLNDGIVDALEDLYDNAEAVVFTDLRGSRDVVVTEFSHSGDADDPRLENWSLGLVQTGDESS